MKAIAAFGILAAFLLLQTASVRADQCPPNSGKYCPAGTHCAYGDCVYDNPWKTADTKAEKTASTNDRKIDAGVSETCQAQPLLQVCQK